MIFFCEDCGEKNDLGKADLKNGRAIFRCCSCHYLNSYPVSTDLKEIDILFRKIQSYPEIIGAFLYHGKNRAIKNHMPDILTEADLKVLGIYLTRSYLIAESHYPDIQEVTITISDKHITLRRIGPNLFVFVLSTTLPLPEEIKNLPTSANKEENHRDFF